MHSDLLNLKKSEDVIKKTLLKALQKAWESIDQELMNSLIDLKYEYKS